MTVSDLIRRLREEIIKNPEAAEWDVYPSHSGAIVVCHPTDEDERDIRIYV